MDKERRIYCIEGVWGDTNPELSVRPALVGLKEQGYWPHLSFRRCTNYQTLQEQLSEFEAMCDYGSVLYVATHGHKGSLEFSDKLELRVEQLETMLWGGSCAGCFVHFSSCLTLSQDESVFRSFLETTQTLAVSGYKLAVGWNELDSPAMLADVAFLSNLGDLSKWGGRDVDRYADLCTKVQKQYPNCDFTSYWSGPD